jgi:Amt family ammonium transporter
VFSGVLSFGLLKLVGAITPLRTDEQDEWAGMDSSEAGERGYILADESSFGAVTSGHGAAAPVAQAQAGHSHTAA